MPDTYEDQLALEGATWGSVYQAQAAEVPPDWIYHRALRHNAILHTVEIERLLARVGPGMRALEIGCGSGWLTIGLARQGADALGLDISRMGIDLARAHFEQIKETIPGRAAYEVADLNFLDLPAAHFDLIVAKGVLHHLVNLDGVIEQLDHALKPGGLLWISDARGDEALSTALVAGALTLLLPTEVSYRDKLRGLARFGLHAPDRVRASIQAEGLSPFEGAGRDHDWLALVEQRFCIEERRSPPAVTGYVSAQLRLPDTLAFPLLRALAGVDGALVRAGVLHSSHLTILARKERQP